MPTSKLTKAQIEKLEPASREYFIWDTALVGFGVRVQTSGAKSYVAKYRAGSGRAAPTRRIKLASTGALTLDEARNLARRTLGSVAHGIDPAADAARERASATLAEVASRFLSEHVETKRSASSAKSYRDLLERVVVPELGKRKANSITAAEIQKLHNRLFDRPYQANRVIRVLSSLFTFASRINLVPTGFNPCRGVEFFPEESRERYLTGFELGRIGEALREAETLGLPYKVDDANPNAKHAPKPETRQPLMGLHAIAAIRLLLFTGARLREILHLRWQHVDLERGLLFLPSSKTGKKTIILNAASIAILRNLPCSSNFVIAGSSPDRPRADLKKPWSAIAERAELKGVRIHDLRHTHASVGAGAGLGLPIIGKLLGHTQSSTTQRYAHLDSDPLRQASENIAEKLSIALGDEPSPDARATGSQEHPTL